MERKEAIEAYEKASAKPKSAKNVQAFHTARAALRAINKKNSTGKYAH